MASKLFDRPSDALAIVLFRVDERLIHGQVVIGWGNQLIPDRYLVVDDELAESAWERELYELCVSEDVAAEFHSTEEALPLLAGWREDETRSVLLARDLETMLRLARDGALTDEVVNLGGIHHADGRAPVRPYLFLDDGDRQRIRALVEAGVEVTGQDLPSSPRVGLPVLLGRE